MFKAIKTTEIEYTVKAIKNAVTGVISRGAKDAGRAAMARRDYSDCMKLLCGYMRQNRWELFDTFEPYKVITNGYGEFKQVELESGRIVKPDSIFRQMHSDAFNCNIEINS